MIVGELEKRDDLRRREPQIGEILDNEDKPEEQYLCLECKAFCYLSQVICQCTRHVACPDHAEQLCNCGSSSRTLRKRLSESQLIDIQRAVSERAAIPQTWRARFEKALNDTARPSAKSLRALVSEGEKITHPMPELVTLRNFVAQVNTWMVQANVVLNRKKAGARKRASRVRDDDGDITMDPTADDATSNGDHLVKRPSESTIHQLLGSADKLGFVAPEIVQLRQLVESVDDFRKQAQKLLATPEQEIDLKECRNLVFWGDSLNVETAELQQLESTVRRKDWYEALNNLDEDFLELSDVETYLEQADEYGVPRDHEFVKNLEDKLKKGQAWLHRAELVVAACTNPDNSTRNITLDELDALCKQDPDVPIRGELVIKIQDLRRKSQGVVQSCQAILKSGPGVEKKSMLQVRKLLKTADTKAPGVIIPELEQIERIVEQYREWMRRLGKLLGETCQTSAGVTSLLNHTKELLDPADDEYPVELNGVMGSENSSGVAVAVSRFNCVCRQPAKAKMLQCRRCLELYHTTCMDPSYIEAPNSRIIKCPFCRSKDPQGHKPRPRPSLLKFTPLLDERVWSFEYEFEEMEQIRELFDICLHVADMVLPKLLPTDGSMPTEDTRFLRHWLRKLRDLPVNIELRPQSGQPVSLYPAFLSRFRILRRERFGPFGPLPPTLVYPPPADIPVNVNAYSEARRRFQWPHFSFEVVQRTANDIPCICVKPPPDPINKVECLTCRQLYHSYCARVHPDTQTIRKCPCCAVNDGVAYEYAEVRCQWRGECLDWQL